MIKKIRRHVPILCRLNHTISGRHASWKLRFGMGTRIQSYIKNMVSGMREREGGRERERNKGREREKRERGGRARERESERKTERKKVRKNNEITQSEYSSLKCLTIVQLNGNPFSPSDP